MGFWQDQLDALYGTPIATDGSLSGVTEPIRVMDKTAGIEVQHAGGVVSPTLQPAATVRRPEITALGFEPRDLVNKTLTLNGTSWRIQSWKPRPTPEGELTGELLLYLTKVA